LRTRFPRTILPPRVFGTSPCGGFSKGELSAIDGGGVRLLLALEALPTKKWRTFSSFEKGALMKSITGKSSGTRTTVHLLGITLGVLLLGSGDARLIQLGLKLTF
jgi:hypothetical protein